MLIESSPQVRSRITTARIMWLVVIALLPAGVWGVVVFGIRSLVALLVSVAAAVLTEWLLNIALGKRTIADGSALLTGLLIGFNMPPQVPLFIPVVASVFAIAIVKWSFGGLGANWMNPALAGRVFVFFSWTAGMSSWKTPATLAGMPDALASATPLGMYKTGMMELTGSGTGTAEFLRSQGYAASRAAQSIADTLGGIFGSSPSEFNIDLFLGNTAGCIGEVSALLLIVGAIFLLSRRILTWHTPTAYIASFALLTWVFGGLSFGNGFFQGEVWFNLFSGGLMLGALFMATDMVTSPLTGRGMLIYGIGAGFLTFLLRFFGSLPEGVSLAIIIMNIFVPMIDRYVKPRLFGRVKKERGE